MKDGFLAKLISRLALGSAGLLIFMCVVFVVQQLVLFFFIDAPLNYYEPELVTEAWALSQGGLTHPPYETGPYSGLYAPFYQFFASLIFLVVSPSLLWMRFLSLIAVALCAEILHRFSGVQHWSSRPLWFFLLMMWHNTLVGFDMQGKPDSLAVLLIFMTIFSLSKFLQYPKNPRFLVHSAVAAAFAVLTKQPALFVAAAAGTVLLVENRYRHLVQWIGIFAAVSVALWLVMVEICGPMLLTNAFVVPGQYKIRFGEMAQYANGAFGNIWFLLATGLFIYRRSAGRWEPVDTLLFSALFWSFPASLLTASKAGGMWNAFQPFFYLILAIIARNASLILDLLRSRVNSDNRNYILLLTALAVFGTYRINIPSEITRTGQLLEYRRTYNRIAKELAADTAQIFIPMDNYLALKAGKPLNYSLKSELDVFPQFMKVPAYRHSLSIADQSTLVVTHRYAEWYKPDEFEEFLIRQGFQKEKTEQLDYNLSISFWRR